MRRPSRRSVTIAASLAVALVAGATVALATRDGGSPVALVPRETVPEPASPSPSPTPTPTPSPSTAPPTPEPTAASPTTRPATTTTTAPATTSGFFGPRQPGGVTVPYRAGQTSWDVTSNGFRIRASMTRAKQGSPMTWTVSASSPNAGCCAIYLLYGDGYPATPQMECGDPDPTVSHTHVYNRAGRHEFMIQVGDRKHCGSGGDGALYGSFDVSPGTSTAQGPSLPVVKFDTSTPVPGHEGDNAYVSLWGEASDVDGYVRKLVVSFGDGTSRTFPGDEGPCTKSADGWPAGSLAWLPHDPPAYHRFTEPGTYTVTLTAYSSGCDGTHVQTGKKSFTWIVPEPEPTASAS